MRLETKDPRKIDAGQVSCPMCHQTFFIEVDIDSVTMTWSAIKVVLRDVRVEHMCEGQGR